MIRCTAILGGFLGAALLSAAPLAAQDAVFDGGKPIEIGRSYSLPSAALGAARTINVWVPPGYAEGDARYPVLYVIDGGLGQDFLHITGLAQLGALSWQTQEMIVVGVETVDRRRELAFPIERDAELKREYPTAGESAKFLRYLSDEVKPFVAAHYRSSGEDAVLGESLAGLFIVETLLRQPDTFDTYIAMDPSLWWDDGRLSEQAAGLLAGQRGAHHRLWLSVGKETLEEPQFANAMLTALRAAPTVELRYEPRPALTHATIYHPTAYDALQAFYPRPGETASKPAGYCAEARTQAEMNACAAQDYALADAALNAQWAITSETMKETDRAVGAPTDGRPSYFDALLDAQRAWLTFRDSHCRVEGFNWRGGSAEPMSVSICMAMTTRARTDQLRELSIEAH